MGIAPVQEHQLANGLTVLTREVHVAPIVSFWVWYRVGSRNEVPGTTGVSHWAEHMVFKGTARFPRGEADKQVAMYGGTRNGFTWIDYTAYYETLPSEHARLAVAIEADRMANAAFDPQEVASERGVVISEREGNENHPGFYLGEEVTAAAFKAHPYGQPVIGFKSDLQVITRDDLWQHYERYYAPNNAVAVAVGDFETAALLDLVQDEFGAIERRPPPPPVRLVEPKQEGERRVVVRRPGPVPQMSIAYHVPQAAHPDTLPLWILGAVLSAGRSSRLYKALVVGGLASSAGAGSAMSHDPYLFRISATARPDADPARVEAVALAEVQRLIEDGVSEAELAKVRRQLRSGHVFSTEGVTSQARYLGQYEMASSWRQFETYLQDLGKVTAEDVVRVAATYLVPDNRTVGWFLPQRDPGGGRGPAMAAGGAP
ncbi:MAG TPA: pitrilysin family protein [Chloroflexota bacterium]|jgi:zinc protease|nr:pitrilysin family protein [Chloroflexota bacterium]